MPRWIVRYRGRERPPATDLDRLARDPEVQVVDRTGVRLALIDVPSTEVPRLHALLPGWLIEREQETELPETWPAGGAR